MKPDQLFQELKSLADRLDLTVLEENFRKTGIKVKSGTCIIKGSRHCVIDKHLRINKKIEVLVKALNQLPHEDIFVMPSVREVLGRSTFDKTNTIPIPDMKTR